MVRRFIFVNAVIFMLSTGASSTLLAANTTTESEFYVKTIPVGAINMHTSGYRVDYMKHDRGRFSFWIPMNWLRYDSSAPENPPRAELHRGTSPAYPYVSFFYKSGKLYSIKLYVQKSPLHPTWEVLDASEDYSDELPQSLEDLQNQLEY